MSAETPDQHRARVVAAWRRSALPLLVLILLAIGRFFVLRVGRRVGNNF